MINLFSFIAEEVREILASLGFRTLDEVIGRTDLLHQVSRGAEHLDDLDLNPLLAQADPGDRTRRYCTLEGRNEVPDTLDAQMIDDAAPLFERGEKMQLHLQRSATPTGRSARSSRREITRQFGMTGLQPGHLTVRLRGSAGQSLGAFAVQGLKLEVFGDANDYVGKGLSGAHHRGPAAAVSSAAGRSREHHHRQHRALRRDRGRAVRGRPGRRALRGAQLRRDRGGRGLRRQRLRIHDRRHGGDPRAGRRQFRRRHDRRHGLCLRPRERRLERRINRDMVIFQRLEVEHYEDELKALLTPHAKNTQSRSAERVVADFDREVGHFWQIVPKEMLDKLEVPVVRAGIAALTA